MLARVRDIVMVVVASDSNGSDGGDKDNNSGDSDRVSSNFLMTLSQI